MRSEAFASVHSVLGSVSTRANDHVCVSLGLMVPLSWRHGGIVLDALWCVNLVPRGSVQVEAPSAPMDPHVVHAR